MINTVIALQMLAGPATWGETFGLSPFYYLHIGWGGPFVKKVFLDYQQQIEKLTKEKKLYIPDPDYAIEMLKRYSYYSLISGYKEQFKDASTSCYRPDAAFEDIVALYEFDENLRGLFLKYLQKIERQMKSHLSFLFL